MVLPLKHKSGIFDDLTKCTVWRSDW